MTYVVNEMEEKEDKEGQKRQKRNDSKTKKSGTIKIERWEEATDDSEHQVRAFFLHTTPKGRHSTGQSFTSLCSSLKRFQRFTILSRQLSREL